MSFRRDKQQVRKWQTFLEKHRNELLACGIPLTVLSDRQHWEHFMLEGYYTPTGLVEPILDVDNMKREHMQRLCLFLERELPDEPCYAVLNRLQFLLKRRPHADVADYET
jgi:hypothetical protein